jgi:acyl dehydratase
MALQASKLKIGDTHTERVVENLTRTQIVQYAGASGDYNPLHTDEIFTNQVWPGDTLDATATVAAIREEGGRHLVDLTLSTVNQDGREVVTGQATARIDP